MAATSTLGRSTETLGGDGEGAVERLDLVVVVGEDIDGMRSGRWQHPSALAMVARASHYLSKKHTHYIST
jgi:hypothetical protein